MSTDIRDDQGRFTAGNPGGPGRPRRAIEREYLATLGEAVTLDDWRDVVARAVADAKQGDKAACAWLAKYLLGTSPRTLLDIAVNEQLGRTPDDDVEVSALGQLDAEDELSYDEEDDDY
jgi:hypothetical protein